VDLLLDHYPGRILVEADGSAGRSLKGHAAHEPVVSARADAVIAVVGASCLGQALDAAHVHRPERLAECLDLPMGSRLGVPEVVAAMLHPEGWRKALPPGAHAVLLVSQGRAPGAARLAEALRRAFPHVVLAELVAPETGPYQAQLGAGSPERRSTS
jgi:probable selenium-dependent hydroxylase accessory protein YqeC